MRENLIFVVTTLYKMPSVLQQRSHEACRWCLCRGHETWVRFLGLADPLDEGTATHSSILVWRITRTEEPGRLQSRGSQRVRHNWRNLACTKLNKKLWSLQSGGNYPLETAPEESQMLDLLCRLWAFQVELVVKNPSANAGQIRDMGLILGLGRSLG